MIETDPHNLCSRAKYLQNLSALVKHKYTLCSKQNWDRSCGTKALKKSPRILIARHKQLQDLGAAAAVFK